MYDNNTLIPKAYGYPPTPSRRDVRCLHLCVGSLFLPCRNYKLCIAYLCVADLASLHLFVRHLVDIGGRTSRMHEI